MDRTPVRIFLARHGETESNVAGRWQGQTDSPLTERGLRQAQALGAVLGREQLVAVYASDLGRAIQTAEAVVGTLGLPVTINPLLREIDTGEWTGRVGSEIGVETPDLYHVWRTRPGTMRIPGGETLAEAQARALRFFAETMPRHLGQSVAVISHGTMAQAILVHALGLTVDDLWLEQRVDNAQVSRLEWGADTGLRVVDLADTRHLAEIGSLHGWRVTDQAEQGEATARLDTVR